MRIGVALFCLLLGSTVARAAEPTTRPTVLLLRFAQLNDAAGTEWVGRVVQESLLTDTARIPFVAVAADQRTGTTDLQTARQLAKDANADVVVLGGYQTISQEIKITGQMVDVSTGKLIGTLKSTATIRDVLTMEDTLFHQLERSLTRHFSPPAGGDSSAAVRVELPDLGMVRLASYTQPFLPPKADAHQQYRDRNTYGAPSYSPYACFGLVYPASGYCTGRFGLSFTIPYANTYGN